MPAMPTRRLGDHALGRRSLRQRRDRRQVERRKRELGRRRRRAVRQAADPCGDATWQLRAIHPDHFLADIVPHGSPDCEPGKPSVVPPAAASLAKPLADRQVWRHAIRRRPCRLSAVTGLWGPRISWLVVAIAGSLVDRRRARRPVQRGSQSPSTVGAWLRLGRRRRGAGGAVDARRSPALRMVRPGLCGVRSSAGSAERRRGRGCSVRRRAAVTCMLVGGAEFGQRCVQASAYGDEQRFLLRPPAASCRRGRRGRCLGRRRRRRAAAAGDWPVDRWCRRRGRRGAVDRGCWSAGSIAVPALAGARSRRSRRARPGRAGRDVDGATRSDIERDRAGTGRHRGRRPHRSGAGSRGRDHAATSMATTCWRRRRQPPRGTALHAAVVHRRPDTTRHGCVRCRAVRAATRDWSAGDAAAEHVAVGRVVEDDALAGRHAALRGRQRTDRRRASSSAGSATPCALHCTITSPSCGSSAHTTSLTSSLVDVADRPRRRRRPSTVARSTAVT